MFTVLSFLYLSRLYITFFLKLWIVKERHRAVLAQLGATVVPAPAGECSPTRNVVATGVAAPGGTAVGEGTAGEGAEAAGDRGKTREEEGVVVVVVTGVVIQE